jgi:low affinity Fe/Cu permease
MGNTTQTGNASNGSERSWLYQLGCDISVWVSDIAAHPYVQLGLVIFCISWFALGLDTNLLTAALSILAITLTQMVLNRQNEREADARRRDVAMHAKVDELIIAVRRAHNEMAGIEELPEEEIAQLKEEQQLNIINGAESDAERQLPGRKGRAESSG